MKFFDKIARRFAQTASVEVKSEVQKTVYNFLPKLIAIGASALSLWLFKDAGAVKPTLTASRITTNNYFFSGASEELIRHILEKEVI